MGVRAGRSKGDRALRADVGSPSGRPGGWVAPDDGVRLPCAWMILGRVPSSAVPAAAAPPTRRLRRVITGDSAGVCFVPSRAAEMNSESRTGRSELGFPEARGGLMVVGGAFRIGRSKDIDCG